LTSIRLISLLDANLLKKIANKFSDYNRIRKYKTFIDYFKPKINTKIIDVGASEGEYQENANIIEKRYSYPENIIVLGIDNFKEFPKRYPKVKIVIYGGDVFPFKDKNFDICWCNAVIEHVGNTYKQEKFLKEICRVSKKAFITTPNRYFPFEVHSRIFLFHYLPKRVFDKLLIKLGKSWVTGDYMYLLRLKDIKKLLLKCNINKYKIIKNRILGFVVDFVIIF